jgi:hypothetical protein
MSSGQRLGNDVRVGFGRPRPTREVKKHPRQTQAAARLSCLYRAARRRNDNPSSFPGDERLTKNHVRPYKAGVASAPESANSRTTKRTCATKVSCGNREIYSRVRSSISRGTDDFPAQLHDRRRQKRFGRQFFGVTGIGASRNAPQALRKPTNLTFVVVEKYQ